MTQDVLVIDALVRSFGDLKAVDGVSFRIAPGETYGLLGPNGAGKTTTISMVAGLIRGRRRARSMVAGHAMTPDRSGPSGTSGWSRRSWRSTPTLTGRENLRLFGRLQGLRGTELTRRVEEVLDLIGLRRPGQGPHEGVLRRYEAPTQHRRSGCCTSPHC